MFAKSEILEDKTHAALEVSSIRTVVIIAEGVPISDVRRLISRARQVSGLAVSTSHLLMVSQLGKVIIGPATVGGIQAGAFKIGAFH